MAGHFSHNGKDYFFLHIPKTGGKMWEHFFSEVGLRSGHALVRSKPKGYSFTVIRNPFDRLVSCFSYLKCGGCCGGDADDAIKYGIVQNSFSQWVKLIDEDPDYYFEQQHIMPMMRRIGKKEHFDHIGLFENLEEETIRLYSRIYNLPSMGIWNDLKTANSMIHTLDADVTKKLLEIPVINKSDHQHFEEYYTEETKNIVANLYKEDITLYKEILHAQNI